MQSKVTAHEIQDMVRHWLRTPPNGYLGSSYGADLKALLHSPMSAGLADAFIDKMLQDVPILATLPAGAVNLYAEELSNDAIRLIIDLNGSLIRLDGVRNPSPSGKAIESPVSMSMEDYAIEISSDALDKYANTRLAKQIGE